MNTYTFDQMQQEALNSLFPKLSEQLKKEKTSMSINFTHVIIAVLLAGGAYIAYEEKLFDKLPALLKSAHASTIPISSPDEKNWSPDASDKHYKQKLTIMKRVKRYCFDESVNDRPTCQLWLKQFSDVSAGLEVDIAQEDSVEVATPSIVDDVEKSLGSQKESVYQYNEFKQEGK